MGGCSWSPSGQIRVNSASVSVWARQTDSSRATQTDRGPDPVFSKARYTGFRKDDKIAAHTAKQWGEGRRDRREGAHGSQCDLGKNKLWCGDPGRQSPEHHIRPKRWCLWPGLPHGDEQARLRHCRQEAQISYAEAKQNQRRGSPALVPV